MTGPEKVIMMNMDMDRWTHGSCEAFVATGKGWVFYKKMD